MSVNIETTEELQQLLRKLGVKISSVDELRQLLATINAHYNPEAARSRIAKLVGISVPCTLGSIAGLVSIVVAGASHDALLSPYFVGAMALVWGTCALVSVAALIFSFSLVIGRGSRAATDQPPPNKLSAMDERVMSALGRDLSL
jgi:hypothetical protein